MRLKVARPLLHSPWCQSVVQFAFTRGQSVQTKPKQPTSLPLQSECEVRHLQGVNKLKSRTMTETTTGSLTSSTACLD